MPIEPMGPVVVGVNGSASSLAALDLAADEAAGRVTPLLVLHAYGPVPHVVPACAPEWVERATAARRLLRTAVGEVNAEHPGLGTAHELAVGDPVDALVARSTEACLVVVGPGHVARRLATRSTSPVLVHRPLDHATAAESPRPVLVGVDDRPDAEATIAFAFAEAALRGAPLEALHVWSHHPSPHGFAARRKDTELMLEGALATWAAKYPDVSVRHRVAHSLDVAGTLRDASAHAQLIVVGRCEHGAPGSASCGTITNVLLHRAGCPVAVVP